MNNNWQFIESSNKTMSRFFGQEVCLESPKKDGGRVLYAYKPGNRRDWLFYTSRIENITRDNRPDKVVLTVKTRNSAYIFEREARVFYEEITHRRNHPDLVEVVDEDGNPTNPEDYRPGDRLLFAVEGTAIWTKTPEIPDGYWQRI